VSDTVDSDRELLVEPAAGGVVTVTLNRPERLNALSWELVDELGAALDQLAADPECRLVILTGAGRGFCSGIDLKAGEDSISGASIEQFMARQEAIAALASRLHQLPQPVIAAVNGAASGGGLALALAADMRVCSRSARFNVAFVRIGLSGCDVGVSYFLPRIVGSGLAAELMMTGRFVDAAEAGRIGLANAVADDGELLEAAAGLAAEVLANAPFALRMTKEVLGANVDAPSLAHALALENRTQAVASRSAGHAEALSAWHEKRPPDFGDVSR
jgi:enoyl-CoA hydratase